MKLKLVLFLCLICLTSCEKTIAQSEEVKPMTSTTTKSEILPRVEVDVITESEIVETSEPRLFGPPDSTNWKGEYANYR